MKLLFLIKTLGVVGGSGGAERVLADITGELASRGHEVAIASFDNLETRDFHSISPAVRRFRLGVGDGSRPAGVYETVGRMRSVRRLVLKEKPDVTIGFMHSVYIPQGIALLGTGVPLIASEHISFDHYRTRHLQGALLRLIPLLARAVTIPSDRVRRSFPSSLRRRMTVIANPVTMAGAERANVAGHGRMTLLCVGRMTEQKDHAVLITAFGLIADSFPDWKLKIIGEGRLRTSLENQVAALGLEGRVELLGATPDIGREYRQAQLFAMPSRYESFGLVTAEALAYGLPVVGFADCAGTNELIENGVNGLLVSGVDRAAALAEGLTRLMRSPELRIRLGETAPESVSSYRLDKIVDAWESLLQAV